MRSASGAVCALGVGVLIGRIGSPRDGGSSIGNHSDSGKSGERSDDAGLSLAERVQRKRSAEGRDASSRPVDKDLKSIMETNSRLDRTQRLLAFLDRLPADQFAGIYEEFRNSPGAELFGSERSLILQAWAERDPLTALSFLQEKGAEDWERETAVATWASNDPQAALAWASTAQDEGRVNNWLLGAARGVAATNPELARDFIAQLEGRTKNQALDAVQPYVLQFGFDYATTWIAGVGDEETRDRAARSMAGDLAELDPARAAQWNAAITNVENRRDISETVSDRWASSDLASARKWVESLPEDTKSEAAEGVARHYARLDPTAAAQWLNTLGNNPDLDGARSVLIEESFRTSPAASLEYVSKISDPRSQEEHYRRYLRDWMRRDEGSAQAWMASNAASIPPQVLQRFNGTRP